MLPGQLLLDGITGPAFVPGPVFLSFEIQGKPGHKARHRSRIVIPTDAWTRWGTDRVITATGVRKIWIQNYPDPNTAAYEKVLAYAARSVMKSKLPTAEACVLLAHSFREIPKSWSKRDQNDAMAGRLFPTSRPDWDNYGKITDALNGIVWNDDSQVIDGRVIKRYSATPGLRIEVREMIDPDERPPKNPAARP